MSTQVTREQLIKKKEQLLKSLDEVTKSLNHFDEIVYRGKFEKAIYLLKEVLLEYLNYPTINLECPECGENIEFDLEWIIDGLENLCKEEFKNNG
jgi:hypothetical protein